MKSVGDSMTGSWQSAWRGILPPLPGGSRIRSSPLQPVNLGLPRHGHFPEECDT